VFHTTRAHPHLHSFPTRRSSDLNKFELRPQDLLFDTLTFTLGSGDEEFRKAGIETIEAIRLVKKELPGVFTTLGVSNISFGLARSEEHTSELQSRGHLVCRLLLE